MANVSDNPKLQEYWQKPVSELAYRNPNKNISPGQKERHRLYALLALAVTQYFWNGYKRGKAGRYPLNPKVAPGTKYLDGDYYGHNILALAVNFDGEVLDFEMNHNVVFNSSAEHAEARLVRRIFSLAALSQTWQLSITDKKGVQPEDKNDYNTFEDISIYTTLESCSQCSGIMALAQVKEIIYLQTDPGMYLIGNILRNLTEGTKLQAPNPIDGIEIEFEYFGLLNTGFKEFNKEVSADNPFFIPDDETTKPDASKSVTSFLCSKKAYEIYTSGKTELLDLISGKKMLSFPEFKSTQVVLDSNNQPVVDVVGKPVIKTARLTNREVLTDIEGFYRYCITNGRRGSPHK